MTKTKSKKHRSRKQHRPPVRSAGRAHRGGQRGWMLLGGGALLLAVVAFAIPLGRGGDTSTDTPSQTRSQATGPMGGRVITTPGLPSGRASAGGIEVDGAVWEMGQVPNEVTVIPDWRLRNTSDRPVVLGRPLAEIVAGCCPGELSLSATTLAPGEVSRLEFPLQMHDGMDGWHDFRIHVPVTPEAGDDTTLVLGVTGDFG